MSLDHEKDFMPEATDVTKATILDESLNTEQTDTAETAVTPTGTTPEESTPFYKKPIAKLGAAVAAVVIVGGGAFAIGKGSSSETSSDTPPVASASPNPEDEAIVVNQDSDTEAEESLTPVVEQETEHESVADTGEEPATAVSPENTAPVSDTIEVETPLNTTVEVSRITSSDPNEMLSQALNLLACYESLSNEDCLNAFSDDQSVKDIFIDGTVDTRADFVRAHNGTTPNTTENGVIYRLTGGLQTEEVGDEVVITPDRGSKLESCRGLVANWDFENALENTRPDEFDGELSVRDRHTLNEIRFTTSSDGTYKVSGVSIDKVIEQVDFTEC